MTSVSNSKLLLMDSFQAHTAKNIFKTPVGPIDMYRKNMRKQEHILQKPAAIIEIEVIVPSRSNYWPKMHKIAINRQFYFQVSTHYVVVETYCFCWVRPPPPPRVFALTHKPLLGLFPNIYSMPTGPGEFAW